jgi:hypothetical protein
MRLALLSCFALAVMSCSSESDTCNGPCLGPTGMPGPEQNGPVADGGASGGADSSTGGGDLGGSGGDLGACCDMNVNPAGPWPVADLTVYGAAQGLPGGIIDASQDDAQNIWAVSADALYLLRPGQTTFTKFTAADGLHIGPFTDPAGRPNTTSITAVAGGHANEVFVGYYGYEGDGDPYLDTLAQKQLGNADKVTVDAAGKLTVTRYYFKCDYEGGNGCWENRSPRRMLYAHSGVAAGHLFLGMNHGVTHVFNDDFGDHIHPSVWYVAPDGSRTQKLGEFYGLALTPAGDLWVSGRYAVGLQTWNPVPRFSWVDGKFKYAFTIYTANHEMDTVPNYKEEGRGVGITPDGTVWFASFTMGLSSWNPVTAAGNYTQVRRWNTTPGLPTSEITDLTADLDGTLWLTTHAGALLRFDPASNTVVAWPGVSGARRIVIDTTVTPRALYVSMDGGLAVIRAK